MMYCKCTPSVHKFINTKTRQSIQRHDRRTYHRKYDLPLSTMQMIRHIYYTHGLIKCEMCKIRAGFHLEFFWFFVTLEQKNLCTAQNRIRW